ncbi:transporter [Pseudocolwellia agarivorans]|uniref:transporter n=1 Tax=Pseudocolwellia agarivorans TaxID=1911682 RepID=UPI000985BE20|nr:transporter [Pseudocolwellia agarivorans]
MNKHLSLFLCLLFLLISNPIKAQDLTSLSLEELGEIDVFPGTVLDTHIHQKNDMMFALYQSYSEMDSLGRETKNISINDTLSQYMVSPTHMSMRMTMFHAMYAYSDNLTFAFMTHFMDMSMKHVTRMKQEFTTQSQGIGDSAITLNYLFNESHNGKNHWIMHTSFIIPTGSIDEKGTTPLGYVQLPYAMQLGQGSYQLKLGMDYTLSQQNYIVSANFFAQSPINTNEANYKVGDSFSANLTYLYSLTNIMSLDAHINYMWQNSISGFDERLNSNIVPTANTNNYGGKNLNINVGVSWLLPYRNKISVSYVKPIWQNIRGIQLQKNEQINLSWEITL